MSKLPTAPPPGDKPVPTAPPPPPAWRHWLWPGALLVMVLLYLFLPGIPLTQPVSLKYSQFISDASAHKFVLRRAVKHHLYPLRNHQLTHGAQFCRVCTKCTGNRPHFVVLSLVVLQVEIKLLRKDSQSNSI